MKKKLVIGRPFLKSEKERTCLCAEVTYNDKTDIAWFSVEKQYEQYLAEDRIDAFVIGFLTTAMRMGADIVSEAPITRRLKYQLNQYLIPSMAQNMEIYHSISIEAPVTDEKLPCAKAVGTGWTGGVDSMYTLMKHMSDDASDHKITHLVIANNGALESDHNTELLAFMVKKARNTVAAELGLNVIGIDSNLQLLQDENYLAVAGFRLPAAVLAVQKLFGVFLHSGNYEFTRFAFVQENSAYYELLPLDCFETDCTVFYSAGSSVSRIQKLEELSNFSLARKYLHPCIYAQRDNCCECGKCIRTMGALYALGTLDQFRQVFDVDRFYEKKADYFYYILSRREDPHYGEVIAMMNKRGLEIPKEAIRKDRIRRAAMSLSKSNLEIKDDPLS